MSNGLRPCPFCGGSVQRVKSSGRWGWFVSCQCAAVGPSADTRQLAIERWNERRQPRQMELFGDDAREDRNR
ncbi:Lar family restriction alleviation protein [Olsenella uli]|uniref:Lar family restriction alleviation protein n=1 Tax=Olsenella uli TaxID=133926 RepID=UPI003C6E29AA